jgi:DNA-binding MarR family transcriptional regulator
MLICQENEHWLRRGGTCIVARPSAGAIGEEAPLSRILASQERAPRKKLVDTPTQAELPMIWHLFGDEGLAQRLLLLAKMIERVASRKLQEEFDLSVAQWRVLAFVCISGPATAAFIGDAAEADPAEISRAVKALAGRELVTRTFERGNRKTMVIAPTDEGAALFSRVRRERQKYFARITRRLSASRKADVGRFLVTVAEDVVAERAGARDSK